MMGLSEILKKGFLAFSVAFAMFELRVTCHSEYFTAGGFYHDSHRAEGSTHKAKAWR